MDWKSGIEFLHRWQSLIGGVIVGTTAIYYGPRKALETWDWYARRFKEKYDAKVHHFLHERWRQAKLQRPGRNVTLPPAPIAGIAESIGRKEKKVYLSLRRLEGAGKVQEVANGWIVVGQELPKPVPRITVL